MQTLDSVLIHNLVSGRADCWCIPTSDIAPWEDVWIREQKTVCVSPAFESKPKEFSKVISEGHCSVLGFRVDVTKSQCMEYCCNEIGSAAWMWWLGQVGSC